MNNNELSQSMYEVSVILENTDRKLIQKIPEKVLNTIKQTAKKQVEFKYNRARKLKDQEISNTARGILALIYRDYFCSEEQRKIYNEYYVTAREQVEIEKSEKYSVDKIFSKSNNEQEIEQSTALIPYEKESIWTKIKNKLIRLFR